MCKYNITNFNNQVFDDKKLNELKEGFGNNKEKGSKYYNLTAIDHDRWAGYILLEQRYGYMDDTHWDKRANEYKNLRDIYVSLFYKKYGITFYKVNKHKKNHTVWYLCDT
ncbi:MAG: hypothetical protein J6M39_09470 [Lachnospiraceae bacterium]|nr:hypothetical protein [Lachnospiraceae bacterium]